MRHQSKIQITNESHTDNAAATLCLEHPARHHRYKIAFIPSGQQQHMIGWKKYSTLKMNPLTDNLYTGNPIISVVGQGGELDTRLSFIGK